MAEKQTQATEQVTANVEQQLPLEEKQTPIPKYTEEQVREIYSEGQKNGYVSAIKHIRSEVNDYLNELLIAVMKQ
jgi:uncharacterized protein (UPF0335 family)